MDIADRVGVTSFAFHSMSMYDMLEHLERGGFSGVEIHLGDFEAEIGNPWGLTQCGVWPRSCSREERARLRERLATFNTVTVHGTPFDVNIAAINHGIREESVRQYLEAIEFAADIGSRTVTFHFGWPSSVIDDPKNQFRRRVEFAKRAADLAGQHGIAIGIENLYEWEASNKIEEVDAILRATNAANFGVCLDIGHVVCKPRGDTDAVFKWIDAFEGRITEIQAHSVLSWAAVGSQAIDHLPFDQGTCLDMPRIFRKLSDIGYAGPIILEIVQPTTEQAIAACQRAKQVIVDAWQTRADERRPLAATPAGG